MERSERLSGTDWLFRYDDLEFLPGTDSFLLSGFPRLKPGLKVCDLGSGSGLLAMLLLRREPSLCVTCVELSGPACRLAVLNAETNGLCGRLAVRQADLRDFSELPLAGSFDLVVCNPPYFPVGGGASAPGPGRRRVREEITCTLPEVCRAAAHLLRWGGIFCLVHRPERLVDLCWYLRSEKLEPKRLRMVQQMLGKAPSLLLLEGRRGGKPGLLTEPPLTLQEADGTPTGEVDTIYGRTERTP